MKADSLDALLHAERGRKGFSSEERAALWKGVELSLGPVLAAPAPSAPPADPVAPPTPALASIPATADGLSSLKIAALVALAGVGGAGIGAVAHARWGEPRIVIVEHAAEPAPTAALPLVLPAASAPPSVPSALATATAVPAPVTAGAGSAVASPSFAAPRPSGTSKTTSAGDPALARERMLLDMARTALSRGDAASALSAVDTHAHEFPTSQLAEEREVIAIQALASASRLPEARRRAAAFRTAYPRSALLPIVEESTQ